MNSLNKRILIIMVILLVMIESVSIFLMYKSSNNTNEILESINQNDEINKEMFAILIKQEDGTYQESTNTSWLSLSEGYEYNVKLSGCVDKNGNKIEGVLNYQNGIATVETKTTTYCYLYFDIKLPAFAIYSEDDNSLKFYKNQDAVEVGDTYKNLTVTAIFTGFEAEDFKYSSVEWDDEYSQLIETIEFVDVIKPVSTAGWFADIYYAETIDVTNLDVSNVIDMSGMFTYVGSVGVQNFQIIGMDEWDTSKVTNMSNMFYMAGYPASTFDIGSISQWNTSNVTNMEYMFGLAGIKDDYSLDLSGWTVTKVTKYEGFNEEVESKVKAPSFGTTS